ncbi:MAG: hypothetical protein PHV77_03880 [Candidatus Omnitrophica bacterium]|nr:hypothetical protein [Candidatus Omnitrophota bacterium]
MRFTNMYRKNSMYLFVTALVLSVASYCYAADSASVVVKGLTEGSLNVVVRNISNNQPASNGLITWSNLIAGQTGWRVANQYIEISHSGLPAGWGIQIYSDNKNTSASPKYIGTANPAGLVNAKYSVLSAPMAWQVTDSVISPTTPVQRADNTGFTNYLWHFLKDVNTTDDPKTEAYNETFQNAEDYITVWNQSGIAWNEGGRTGNPKKAYIYLAANFTMSPAGSQYQTSTLTIEVYKGVSPFPVYIYKDASLADYPDEAGATLANHFNPSGWMNYNGQFSVNPKCKSVIPYSPPHCFEITWNGNEGSDGWTWGGIQWLEPADIWEKNGKSATHNGYDLRGASALTFWARTNTDNKRGLSIGIYMGNTWDSCKQTSTDWVSLSTQWKKFSIYVSGRNMSNVTGGLAIVFDSEHDPEPEGCVIYIDDIKFE